MERKYLLGNYGDGVRLAEGLVIERGALKCLCLQRPCRCRAAWDACSARELCASASWTSDV
jgi:hypothetical protein